MRIHTRLAAHLRQPQSRGVYVMPPPDDSQQVQVQVQGIRPQNTLGYLCYMQQKGKGQDGSKAVLFNRPGRVNEGEAKAFAARAEQDREQFQVIVSPEHAITYLHAYILEWMWQVEKDLRTAVEWVAANHYDTDHLHCHMVWRNVDADGMPFRLEKHYLTQGLRYRAMALATEYLGPDFSRI